MGVRQTVVMGKSVTSTTGRANGAKNVAADALRQKKQPQMEQCTKRIVTVVFALASHAFACAAVNETFTKEVGTVLFLFLCGCAVCMYTCWDHAWKPQSYRSWCPIVEVSPSILSIAYVFMTCDENTKSILSAMPFVAIFAILLLLVLCPYLLGHTRTAAGSAEYSSNDAGGSRNAPNCIRTALCALAVMMWLICQRNDASANDAAWCHIRAQVSNGAYICVKAEPSQFDMATVPYNKRDGPLRCTQGNKQSLWSCEIDRTCSIDDESRVVWMLRTPHGRVDNLDKAVLLIEGEGFEKGCFPNWRFENDLEPEIQQAADKLLKESKQSKVEGWIVILVSLCVQMTFNFCVEDYNSSPMDANEEKTLFYQTLGILFAVLMSSLYFVIWLNNWQDHFHFAILLCLLIFLVCAAWCQWSYINNGKNYMISDFAMLCLLSLGVVFVSIV